jgi:RHS repeat-associated protein
MFQLTATRSPSGEVTEYFYDPMDNLMAIRRMGEWYYVLTDQVGTPRMVVDSAGNILRKIEWDSYGRQMSDSNPSFELAVGFAGGILDPLTGLVRFGLRDYDPATGRMTAWDPLLFAGRQMNLYQYAGNNPVIMTDRSGEELVTAVSVGIATAYLVYKALKTLNEVLEEDLGKKQKELEKAAKSKDKKGLEKAYAERNRALARCAAEAGKTAVQTVPYTPPTAVQDVIQGMAMEQVTNQQFQFVLPKDPLPGCAGGSGNLF